MSQSLGRPSHCIIGGTYKAATTSLYRYLNGHREVCGAALKETRFFLDPSYPVQAPYRYAGDLEVYRRYFAVCPESAIHLEATPFYLYSPGTAERIRRSLPDPRMVFVLREPVDRLISCYNYRHRSSKQVDQSFDDYVAAQYAQLERDPSSAPHTQLAMGCYSRFLQAFVDAFGEGSLHILFFEEIRRDAKQVVRSLCGDLGIDPHEVDGMDFRIHNRSTRARSALLQDWARPIDRLRFGLTRHTTRWPRFHARLRSMKHAAEPLLSKWATVAPDRVAPSESTMRFLTDYYAGERAAIEGIAGREPPWTGPADGLAGAVRPEQPS